MIHIGPRDVAALARAIFGQGPPLRDPGALAGALGRPRNVSSFGETSPFVVASYYADGIVRSHPFVDGNKRMAWGATAMVLALNGFSMAAVAPHRMANLVVALADGTATREYFAGFLDAASERRAPSQASPAA